MEAVLWILLLSAAFALRLVDLGGQPFTLREAARAFEILRVAEGTVPSGWRGDLEAALTAHLFRLFGEGEALARLVPALAGCGLVAVLWLGRSVIGRGVALITALLLAFSPLFLLAARAAIPFSMGAFLGATMVISLFGYLGSQRPAWLFLLALSLGLASFTDAVAVSTVLAVVAFLLLEGALMRSRDLFHTLAIFRRSPSRWLVLLLVLAAAAQMGLTRFGTGLDLAMPVGFDRWRDMFATSGDGRAAGYIPLLLLGYEWPLLIIGALGFLVLVVKALCGGLGALTPFQRFLPLWALMAAGTVGVASQREAAQLLILLLPLAFLGGVLVERALNLSSLPPRLLWGLPLAALTLVAYAALLLTQWARPGGAEAPLQVWLSLTGAALLLAVGFARLGRGAVPLLALFGAGLALPFLAHTSLAVAFQDGPEFAVDLRATEDMDQFREVLIQVAAERGDIAVDPTLSPSLAWHLRDSPVTFDAPMEGAAAVLAPAARPPSGFMRLGRSWILARRWEPSDLDALRLWRWLVQRSPYGEDVVLKVAIFIPTI